MPVSLSDLFTASPYLNGLNARFPDWLDGALRESDAALRAELAGTAAAGVTAADEAAIGDVLRAAKGRVALLAAAAETSGRWTTAQSTAALSDFADAALDAGLNVLLRLASDRGTLKPGVPPGESGLALFGESWVKTLP